MHHVPDAVVCNQLMACKQSDNHWLYPNSELSDVVDNVRVICSCCSSCVSVPSVRNTKKLRDKPNLLASIRAASDGAGAGSDSLAPTRPGLSGLRGHNQETLRHSGAKEDPRRHNFGSLSLSKHKSLSPSNKPVRASLNWFLGSYGKLI